MPFISIDILLQASTNECSEWDGKLNIEHPMWQFHEIESYNFDAKKRTAKLYFKHLTTMHLLCSGRCIGEPLVLAVRFFYSTSCTCAKSTTQICFSLSPSLVAFLSAVTVSVVPMGKQLTEWSWQRLKCNVEEQEEERGWGRTNLCMFGQGGGAFSNPLTRSVSNAFMLASHYHITIIKLDIFAAVIWVIRGGRRAEKAKHPTQPFYSPSSSRPDMESGDVSVVWVVDLRRGQSRGQQQRLAATLLAVNRVELAKEFFKFAPPADSANLLALQRPITHPFLPRLLWVVP